jgi:small subunit ribosomal protein S20
MPNIKSAKKRLRKSTKQTGVNLPVKTRVKTARRKFEELVEAGDKAASVTAYSQLCSSIDRAAKNGVMKKNTAVRTKTRAAARLRALAAG